MALSLGKRRRLLGAALILLLGLVDACWIEPRTLLFRDDVRIDLAAPRFRIAHLSDLHIRGDMRLLHRIVDEIAAAKPDLIVISGDLIHDVPDREDFLANASAVAGFVSALRRIAPVYAVQGHSEHQGELVGLLQRAGVEWLSNEGRRIGPGGGVLLLGLNTQVGVDSLAWRWPSPFRPIRIDGIRLYGARRGEPYRNFYSHYDPTPKGLADESGPLAWSGYEVTCDAWIDHEDAGVGLAVHSRYVRGEDRLIEFSRDGSRWAQGGHFSIFEHGSALQGKTDTGVLPEPGRWYRLKVRTEVQPDRLIVRAKAWPVDRPEPAKWQAIAEDRTPTRVTAGTVGLWASGGGTTAYRNLRVVDGAGRILLNEPLVLTSGIKTPPGFRVGARGTRLTMALARSPEVPPGTPVIVLSHMADVAPEASRRGLAAVLAGHTHGGQVRLPIFGAPTTRSSLGNFYDMGRFEFAAPNARGLTTLYINAGVGMSVVPVRFWCPPRWGLVEVGR
ncbi:MAG TPA: metallophosphoesterase [Thermoanaerobaculia bacterium]|nr:metallophosphoesterase [Thermoanaerobaculia bacterium]